MIKIGILPPDITNMGLIGSKQLDFGSVHVDRAFLTAGVAFPPFFGMGVSGYRDSLTLRAGFCQSRIFGSIMERFLDQMLCELP
jgi:NRPS condensation-like uncharacterized protein